MGEQTIFDITTCNHNLHKGLQAKFLSEMRKFPREIIVRMHNVEKCDFARKKNPFASEKPSEYSADIISREKFRLWDLGLKLGRISTWRKFSSVANFVKIQ